MGERNALAELADWFEKMEESELPAYGFSKNLPCVNYGKAKRIIAELAKVSDGEWENICDGPPAYICNAGDLKVQCCIGRCRAIAEEGEGK